MKRNVVNFVVDKFKPTVTYLLKLASGFQTDDKK